MLQFILVVILLTCLNPSLTVSIKGGQKLWLVLESGEKANKWSTELPFTSVLDLLPPCVGVQATCYNKKTQSHFPQKISGSHRMDIHASLMLHSRSIMKYILPYNVFTLNLSWTSFISSVQLWEYVIIFKVSSSLMDVKLFMVFSYYIKSPANIWYLYLCSFVPQ